MDILLKKIGLEIIKILICIEDCENSTHVKIY